MTIPRYLSQLLNSDLNEKIVLLGGPRQVGKTTLSKSIYPDPHYLNYDIAADRRAIREMSWPHSSEIVVLDELHKLPKWKSYLKGIYDANFDGESLRPRILVTGSARLDIVKKVGDSLAGRHRYWKLHPLCVKELLPQLAPMLALERIINQSGFPEPFYAPVATYPRWAKSHLDIILRQDLLDLERVSDILSIETLIELLSLRVGQVVSYESLAEDLSRSPATIKRWITLLENLFVIFRVTPWSKNVARSLLKAPKFYFFDTARVQGDIGARFENAVACSLLKEIDFTNDRLGAKLELHYLRDRLGHELDFLVSDHQTPYLAIEAKWADDTFAPGFKSFASLLRKSSVGALQLVGTLRQPRVSPHGTTMEPAPEWLSKIDFASFFKRDLIKIYNVAT
jgi:predicted AAA+ superfamily ATPase